ncbi:MAG: hypothetical protein AB1498_03945 [bacterium]
MKHKYFLCRWHFGLLIFLIFSLDLNTYAQLTLRKYNARVKVYVKGEVEDKFKEELKSFLNKELRLLNDVAVLEENAEWELIILLQKLETGTGAAAPGMVLSTNVNHFKDIYNSPYYRNIKGWESTHIESDPVSAEYEVKINSPVVYIFKRNLSDPDVHEELKEVCRQIIEDFNNIYLAEDRRNYQEMINYFEGIQNR